MHDIHPQADSSPQGPPDEAIADGDGGDELEVYRHEVRRRLPGRRLDKYIHAKHPRVSRTALQRYIKQGRVTVNGLPSKASYEPSPGDVIEISLPQPPPSDVVPEDIPLEVIYEDEWLLAINKQAGIICHPARATQTGTIANAAAFHAGRLSHGDDPFRPGIMHRLDKNTTGVMLIAKTDEAHWRIALQFERRTVIKEYFAICEGVIRLDADLIDKPLAVDPARSQQVILPSGNPPRQAMFKEAVTEYRVIARYRGFTTVRLFPKTGRTHQLRVHMSSIGHPVLGDRLYGGHWISEQELTGGGSDETLLTHQALHARRLRLMHPIREEPLNLEAPLPAHIQRVVDLLETHRRR